MRIGFSCCALDGVQKGARRKVCPKHRYHRWRAVWCRAKVYSQMLWKHSPLLHHKARNLPKGRSSNFPADWRGRGRLGTRGWARGFPPCARGEMRPCKEWVLASDLSPRMCNLFVQMMMQKVFAGIFLIQLIWWGILKRKIGWPRHHRSSRPRVTWAHNLHLMAS